MKKLYLSILLSNFLLTASLLFAPGMAFTAETNSNPASKTNPINLLEEQEKLSDNTEQNEENKGAEEDAEVASDEEIYKIELLVFAYVNTGEENSEIWRNPKRPGFAEFKKHLGDGLENNQASTRQNKQQQQKLSAIIQHTQKQQEQEQEQEQAENIERHFFDTEEDELSDFKSIMRKMSINGHYRTLKHLIWQQQVMPKSAQDLFYFQGGKNYLTENDVTAYNNSDNKPGRQASQGQSSSDSTFASAKPYLNEGPGTPELEGSLHIYRERFLHIVPDLWFTQFSPNDAGQCHVNDLAEAERTNQNVNLEQSLANSEPESIQSYTPLINFKIEQRRRLRSGELHYIDHPRFGLLVKFSKLETGEGKESSEEEGKKKPAS